MSTPGPGSNPSNSLDSALPLAVARLAFEEGWRSGLRPAIEEVLERTRPLDRSTLLPDLIRVEVRHRRLSGETPRPDESERRFPGDGETIAGIDWTPLTPPVPAPDDVPRRRIARFELVERVGAGGFGEVWRAFDPHLQRDVAVKLAHFVASEDGRPDLLLHEARAAGRLSHPAIVPVHESGVEGDVAYIVSDYVRGTTLDRRLKAGSLPPRDAAALAKTLAEALAYAHAHGVIHRDIKPSNVLLDESGGPHLTDFGIARRVAGDRTISEIGQALGTPAYMSPEQAAGDTAAVDGRSDVYALGLLLFEMVAGRRAYPGDARDALRAVLQGPPPPLRAVCRTVPRDLARIVAVATAYAPQDRYPTAAAMGEDLARYLDGRPTGVSHVRGFRRLRPIIRAMSRPLIAWGTTFCAAVVIPFAVTSPWPEETAAVPQAPIIAPTPDPVEAPIPRLQTVLLDTRPSGAKAWVFPLDPRTGWIDPRTRIDAGTTPCRVGLPPGEFAVVAELPNGDFNETTRWVPDGEEVGGLRQDDLFWERRDGLVVLRPVPIPPSPPDQSLVTLPDAKNHVTSSRLWRPARRLHVPAFKMMPQELSVSDLHRIPASFPQDVLDRQPASDRAALLRYDEAVVAMERLGLRVPSEFEWERAARWNVPDWAALQAEVVGQTEFGPVGVPSADRAGPDLAIFGLRSGAPEWTSSFGDLMPWDRDAKLPLAAEARRTAGSSPLLYGSDDPRAKRSVRGGGDDVQLGDPRIDPETRDPGTRSLVDRFDPIRMIAVRGVRSLRPRRDPADFIRDLSAVPDR